jgi:hypothetical protein
MPSLSCHHESVLVVVVEFLSLTLHSSSSSFNLHLLLSNHFFCSFLSLQGAFFLSDCNWHLQGYFFQGAIIRRLSSLFLMQVDKVTAHFRGNNLLKRGLDLVLEHFFCKTSIKALKNLISKFHASTQ